MYEIIELKKIKQNVAVIQKKIIVHFNTYVVAKNQQKISKETYNLNNLLNHLINDALYPTISN